jgi:alanyl-tRNA synthetase
MRFYYDDAYTCDFTARIVERIEIDGHPAIILDQTYFYPTSGGQPNDIGLIVGVAVLDVLARKEDGAVVHVLAGEVKGETVACAVDWTRRFDHMQHHTGQHILSQAFVQVVQASTVGFHLSTDSITIDLDKTNVSDDAVTAVETLANDVVWANRPVTARIIQPDDAEGVRIRKLPEHLLTGGLRVIDIDDFDVTACGGTHVAHTGEIGLIKILKLEKRGDKTRVEFRCGGRALRDYRDKNAIANQLTADLTCALPDVPQAVSRLQEDFKAEQRAAKAATAQLIEYEALRLIAETTATNGVRVVKRSFTSRDFGEVRILAARLTQEPGTVALLATSDGTAANKAQLVFARSADASYDMNTLLKQTLTRFPDGRGGGQPQMAQGGGSASSGEINSALDAAEQSLSG